MSNSSLTDPQALREFVGVQSLPAVLIRPVKCIAFWSAVVLPFLYFPLLATGLESQSTIIAFFTLVSCNVVALLLGHPYGSS